MVFVLPSLGIAVNGPVFGTLDKAADNFDDGGVSVHAATGKGVKVLERGMVFDTKSKVDGFVLGNPAFDHGELVKPRAGFDHAEGGRVPSELDVGAGEEAGGSADGEGGFVEGLVSHFSVPFWRCWLRVEWQTEELLHL